jgi:hypothetical protein
MAMVPVIKHYCINSFMSSGAPKGSGVTVRDMVKAHDPVMQRLIGLGFLKICRVIP